jgi:chaperonin cofactor prefoldin
MLELDIQLFNDEEQETVEETQSLGTISSETETTTQPFKAFETEEEFSKFTQSLSSKAKGEILKEIGGSNVNEIKDIMSKGKQYDEVNGKYVELETKFNSVISEKDKLQTDLILTKFNIADDFKDEFLTLANAKVNDEVDLQTASQQVFEKLGKNFIKETKPLKIGGDKTKVIPPDVKEENEKLRNL